MFILAVLPPERACQFPHTALSCWNNQGSSRAWDKSTGPEETFGDLWNMNYAKITVGWRRKDKPIMKNRGMFFSVSLPKLNVAQGHFWKDSRAHF